MQALTDIHTHSHPHMRVQKLQHTLWIMQYTQYACKQQQTVTLYV